MTEVVSSDGSSERNAPLDSTAITLSLSQREALRLTLPTWSRYAMSITQPLKHSGVISSRCADLCAALTATLQEKHAANVKRVLRAAASQPSQEEPSE